VIRVRFLRSFDDSLAALPGAQQDGVKAALRSLLDYFDGGPKPLGLGLRQWRKLYWEIRASLGRRVIFSLEGGLATFILVGSHDEVRRRLERL
jgi:mRNA-degrading endonuclease RelE of RelBE toxin-antitoxin system